MLGLYLVIIILIALVVLLLYKFAQALILTAKKVDTSLVAVTEVQIPAGDIDLHGKLLYPKALMDESGQPTGKIPLIIFNHGWGSNLDFFMHFAVAMVISGPFACLLYDCRGHGKSGGEKRLSLQLLDDVKRLIDFADSISGVNHEKYGFMGMSMGGMLALTAGYTDDRIKAIVALCATHNNKENFLYNKDYSWKVNLMHLWMRATSPLRIKSIDVETNRKMSPAFCIERDNDDKNHRALLVHARNDIVVPFSEFERNRDALDLPREQTLVFEKGNHAFLYQHYTILAKATAFLRKKLKKQLTRSKSE